MKQQGLTLLWTMQADLTCMVQLDTVIPHCSTRHGWVMPAAEHQISLGTGLVWYLSRTTESRFKGPVRMLWQRSRKRGFRGGGDSPISPPKNQSFSYTEVAPLT